MRVVLEVDDSHLSTEDKEVAIAGVMAVIRERGAKAGAAEPIVQREGDNQIVALIPGIIATNRAMTLFSTPGQLEFRPVEPDNQCARVHQELDRALRGVKDLPANIDKGKPFTSYMLTFAGGGAFFKESDREAVDLLLATRQAKAVLPRNSTFLWSKETRPYTDGSPARFLYLTENTPVLIGNHFADASARPDPYVPNAANVFVQFDSEGAEIFSRFTGDNVGRQLAIVVDGMVITAPLIQSKLTSGDALITGNLTLEEAEDLAIIVGSSPLPVPVTIIEVTTLRPGRDQ